MLYATPVGPSDSLTILCISGISGKSQVLFALVFTTRYLDLFTNFVSVYNTTMKVFFLASAYATLYLMFIKFKATYDSNHDTFRAEFLLIPVTALAFLVNHEFSVVEVSSTKCLQCHYSLLPACFLPDPLDLLDLFRSCCNHAPTLHGFQDRRGGDHNFSLPVLLRSLSLSVHIQLGVAILH